MKYQNLIIFIILALMISCIDDVPSDFDNPESNWNPSFSFPVGYATMGMDEDSGFDTSLYSIDTLTGHPLWVNEIDVPINYTMPFSMQELNSFSDQIVSILFRLNTQNGFPNQVKFQFYFQDINSINVDSLFVDGPLTLSAGELIGNGETISSSSNQSNILIDQNKIESMESVEYIFIDGSINNVALDTNLIYHYPNYNIDIQLGIQVELSMSISGQSFNTNLQ